MGSLLDPEAAKEFLRRAAALGMNPAIAAAAAQTSSSATTPPSSSGGQSGGGGGIMTSAGSPSDPALRRPRSVYNSQQVAQLEAYFRFNEYIDGERKRRLSQITNIPEHQIKVWFQNRRQKKKREEAEMLQSGSTPYKLQVKQEFKGEEDGADYRGSDGKDDGPDYPSGRGSTGGGHGYKSEDDGADYAPPRGGGNELHAGTIEDDDDEVDERKDSIPYHQP